MWVVGRDEVLKKNSHRNFHDLSVYRECADTLREENANYQQDIDFRLPYGAKGILDFSCGVQNKHKGLVFFFNI